DGNMDGWTIVDEGETEGPSKWQVVNGEVVQSSNIFGPDVPATANRKGTFAYYDDPEAFKWKNYSVEMTFRNTDDDGIGLMFYYQDPDNYYKVDIDRQRIFTKLFKMKNGVETTLAAVGKVYTPD